MKKILVANRGEIAIRVMRTAKEMGISTVAVFSEVDRNAKHVLYADEAYCIGPAPSSQSYLLGEKILEVAKQCGADGIHPGYGFLSENATFAKMVTDSGITFIGPSPEAMDLMGNKLAAKHTVKAYNIPMVPGTDTPIDDVAEAKKVANEIGFPVLLKAAAGGGGKGMRVVENAEEFEEQMDRAVSEAVNAFGDGAVFIEKFVTSPRHIEIQVLGDTHGNIVYLFERECSIQRRHQKVVEEAPSAILTPELREQMGASAVNVARSCNYVGAGTVEFLVDDKLNYYFLEMNTRLQVEHPVTELITGVDLVREQIEIARGKPISFKQEDLVIKGHAVELRVYAEDAANNFMPDTGTLNTYNRPNGPGVRVDDGYDEGMDIPIYYDPMIAKLCTYADTRIEAIDRMVRAIDEYEIIGLTTTLNFGKYVMQHPAFRSGCFDTNFVKLHFDATKLNVVKADEAKIAALLTASLLSDNKPKAATLQANNSSTSNWRKNRNELR